MDAHFLAARKASTHLSLSVTQLNILQALALGQEKLMLPPGLKIEHFDTTWLDGDGYRYTLFFGNGAELGDGIRRKGRLDVYCTQKPGEFQDSVAVSASNNDSFGILSAVGWNTWMGHAGSARLGPEYYRISSSHLDLQAGEIFRLSSNMQYDFYDPLQPRFYDHSLHNGNFSLAGADGLLLNCARNRQCFVTFTSGRMRFPDKLDVDFDVYGDGACDFDAVFRKDGIEEVYSLW